MLGDVNARTVEVICRRFEVEQGVVERGLEGDENFRQLCEDFRECSEVMKTWKQSDSPHAPRRVEEYEEILRALRGEIQVWIQQR